MDRQSQQMTAIQLNNRGAFCLETGRYEKAIDHFVRSLKISEGLVAAAQQDPSSFPNDPCMDAHLFEDYDLFLALPVDHHDYDEVQQEQHHHQDQSSSSEFIYQKPLRIPRSTCVNDKIRPAALSFIIIFNLALSHHLFALQYHHDDDENFEIKPLLEKAVKLYELAYRLQLEEKIDCSLQFAMIIINNLGQVHKAGDDQRKASLCFEHLLSTMMYMIDCDNENSSVNMEGFLRNASHLILKDVCAAAA